MIIEDVGEPENGVSKFFKTEFRREEITFTDEESGLTERVGDYTNDAIDFIAERKSAFDYLNSVMEGRYLRQLYKMWNYFDGPKFIIFEGDWDALLKVAAQKGKGYYRHVLASRLKAIAFNVNWIQTWDKRDTAKFIMQLDEFAKNNKQITIKPRKINLIKCQDERVRVLSTAIGQSKAEKIIKTYKTLDKIVSVLKESPKKIIEISGIGPQTVTRLKELFLSDQEVVFYGRRTKKHSKSTNSSASSTVRKKSKGKEYARAQYRYRTTKKDRRTNS